MGGRIMANYRSLLLALGRVPIIHRILSARRGTIGSAGRVPAGFDYLRTAEEGALFRFDRVPVPAGFFSAHSSQFSEVVKFRGAPLSPSFFAGRDVTHVDTIVERKRSALVSIEGPPSSIPIEIVGLA